MVGKHPRLDEYGIYRAQSLSAKMLVELVRAADLVAWVKRVSAVLNLAINVGSRVLVETATNTVVIVSEAVLKSAGP
jgi:hypothetical protein